MLVPHRPAIYAYTDNPSGVSPKRLNYSLKDHIMTSKKTADLSLDASWVVPVVPRNRVYSDCSVLIKDGKLLSITPTKDVTTHFDVSQRVNLSGKLLLPGLINCHGHAAMTLLRGYADDLPLDTWLQKHVWPAETRWVNEQFVADGSRLAIAEMLLSGTTCFADMYFFPEATASEAHELGIRTQLAFPIADFPNNWSRDADDAMHKGLTLRDKYRSNALIDVVFGPHAPYTVADATLQKIATYSEELQAPIHIHLHETSNELAQSEKLHGKRPIERLRDLGLLSPLTLCVHMTQVNENDITLLKDSGSHVVHCPQSNMKLASGTCPAQELLDAGINLALGTDGAASNNDLDLFAEMQTAALLGKLASGNPSAIDAMSALEMATINGARALGLEDSIGSLEPGKQADIIAIDFNQLATMPMHHPLSQLVYTSTGQRVTDVWVAGERLVHNRKLLRIHSEELKTTVMHWQQQMSPHGET